MLDQVSRILPHPTLTAWDKMADASADLQCANKCGPQEIWVWSKGKWMAFPHWPTALTKPLQPEVFSIFSSISRLLS